MTYTRKQVVTCISVLYLIVTTALAAYAASRANARSVPISDTLKGFATALPIISGLLLEGGYDFTRHQERRKRLSRGEIQRPPPVIIANSIIFVYSTVVITLMGTHVGPASGLHCGLQERWQTMFKNKDREPIQRIQDAFSCCGLANPRDMAWPFPGKSHNERACETAFGRTNGCLSSWKAEEQHIAGIFMAVVGMVFIWQFLIIIVPTQRESWLHRVAPDRISRMIADERHGDTEPRRAIEFVPGYNRYSDRIEEDFDQDEVPVSGHATEEGNGDLNHVFPAVVGQGQQPTVENDWEWN